MRKRKYLGLIILIVMVFNLVVPSFSLAIEQTNSEKDNNNILNDLEGKDIYDNYDNEIEKKDIEEKIIDQNNIEENNTDQNNIEYNDIDKKDVDKKEKLEKDESNNERIIEEIKKEKKEIEEDFSIYIMNNENRINSYKKNDVYYLFVPKGINLSEMIINYTGNIESVNNAEFNKETKQISGNFQNDSNFSITMVGGQTKNIVIMQSDVPAIFVDLNSGITLNTVNSGSKSTKYSGAINVTGCDDSKNNISQNEIEFKGRGNTSWAMPKRSYQIKLNKKANFLGIGKSKEKKWVLIANYQDPTLMKNKIINDLCVQSQLANCPNCSYADLYVNGDYIGNYLVCDKIEIKENRINLSDKEGVIMELDNAYYKDEEYYFQSNRGKFYTVKEAVSDGDDLIIRQAMKSFKDAINSFENELYSANPSWDKISKMIDVESFAKYYLINEFAKNPDEYFSSCFFYKDGKNDVIHIGPTWDYDASFGAGYRSTGKDTNIDFTLSDFQNVMQLLYLFPEFASTVNETYTKDIKPVLDTIDVNQISDTYKQSAKINTLVWSDYNKYDNSKRELDTFVENRKTYYQKRYSNKQIEYSTHVENKGWMTSKRSGISGTEGQSLRIEGLKIEIGSGFDENISISYKSHVQNIGWQNWVSNGQLSGTTGKGLQLEALQIKLNDSSKYSVKYRVHIQDIGWQDWKYDGEVAGTTGQSKRIEAIEIQIIEGRNNIGRNEIKPDALISYKAHIQDIGNTGYGSDGEIIGTTGKNLRLEGIEIKLNEVLLPNISLQVDAHVQDIGWIKGLTDKQFIGTNGKNRRMEALKIKLTGENSQQYDIKYRVHIQDIGWQDWKYNGEMAGTTGKSLRIEAIQIQLIKK